MCSPSRATLFTGLYPAEHGVTLTLTAADLRPEPAQRAGRRADDGRACCAAAGRTARAAGRGSSARGCCGSARAPATRPSCRPDVPNLASAPARRGLRGRLQGQVAPHPSQRQEGRRGLLGGWTAADAERLERDYGFADWEAARRGRERQGRELRRRQRRRRRGLGRGLHPPGRALARPGEPAGAVLPRRLARQPPRRARLSGLLRDRRLLGVASSATSASSCRRPSTRTCAASRASTR